MPCFHPITAYRGAAGGAISFTEGGDSGPPLELPCGRCLGCRKRRTLEWVTRITNEAQMHDANSFVTLTYGENCEPDLNYADFQTFMRKLRRQHRVRFFVAGEYGDINKRPHWHAIIFGKSFSRDYPVSKDAWGSHELDELWDRRGWASHGEVNNTTAGYVAAYCIPKRSADDQKYQRVHLGTGEIIQIRPEFARMSLKPGLGETWIKKYHKEVYSARDGIIRPGGQQIKPPRYYDKIMATINNKQLMEVETNRQLEALKREGDNTQQRLKVKEQYALQVQRNQRERKL